MSDTEGHTPREYEPASDQPDIQKCNLYPGSTDDDGNTTWAVEVPQDASVRVQLVVKADGVEEVVGGAGNMSGRYELTQIQEGDSPCVRGTTGRAPFGR